MQLITPEHLKKILLFKPSARMLILSRIMHISFPQKMNKKWSNLVQMALMFFFFMNNYTMLVPLLGGTKSFSSPETKSLPVPIIFGGGTITSSWILEEKKNQTILLFQVTAEVFVFQQKTWGHNPTFYFSCRSSEVKTRFDPRNTEQGKKSRVWIMYSLCSLPL